MTAPSHPAAGLERPTAPPAGAAACDIAWSDPARAQAFARWLAQVAPAQRLQTHTLRPASADASFRRYFRIDTDTPGLARIVMDAPPAKEDSRPFVRVATLMREAGVTAPQVLAWNEAEGFLLLDDLGRRTMLDVIDRERADANRGLYLEAIDALIRWQLASRPGVLPPYDAALLNRELQLFPDWYLAQHRKVAVEGALKDTLARSFARIVQENLAWPAVYVHRDFMPRNLMVNDGDVAPTLPAAQGSLPPEGARSALGRPSGVTVAPTLGVLDFQDAVHGPITYDIASLMRDAFLSWEEDFVIDITVRYWEAARKAGLPVGEDFGAFYRGVEWMGLQRHLKVAGIFARLTLRDGKPRYLADTPRFIGYIRATASRYRELAPLLRLVDEVQGTQAATGYAFGRM